MDTGKDEGDMNKGKIASGASDNSNEVGLKGGGSETPLNQNAGMDDKAPSGKKGEYPSDASPDTQGVLGKTKGAALDAGGDKDCWQEEALGKKKN